MEREREREALIDNTKKIFEKKWRMVEIGTEKSANGIKEKFARCEFVEMREINRTRDGDREIEREGRAKVGFINVQ